jgi:hypothetical protein
VKNRVLRRIFAYKKGEVSGDWRKLQEDELKILYFSPKFITMINSKSTI